MAADLPHRPMATLEELQISTAQVGKSADDTSICHALYKSDP